MNDLLIHNVEEKLNKDAFARLLKAIPVQLIPDNKFS